MSSFSYTHEEKAKRNIKETESLRIDLFNDIDIMPDNFGAIN